MKLNIETFILAAKRLFQRFPYTTVLIIVEFFLLCFHVEVESLHKNQQTTMILVAIEMGIFSLTMVTIAIQLFAERFKGSLKNKVLMMTGATVLIAALTYLFNYRDIQSVNVLHGAFTGYSYRMAILMFISALSPFILPFIKDKDNREWWNFTATFITRGSVSALYSAVVFIGLMLALFALDTFWSIKLFDQEYAMTFFFAAVLVAPLHLLSGIYVFDEKKELMELPKYLSIFVKYILTPLIGIYVVILYPYIFSFPFKAEWPANEASIIILVLLALGYAGVGLFYGLSEKSKDWKFSRIYTKIFAAISLPTLVFWVYSLFLRIDAFGMTVNRFVLMAIIFWFIGIGVYYLLAKTTNIKYVLISFVALLIVLFYLPFTAFYWGEKSQTARLIQMAKNEGIYKGGKIVMGDKPKNGSSNANMTGIVVYLNKYHTLNNLKNKFGEDILSLVKIDKNGYSSGFLSTYGYGNNVFFKDTSNYAGAEKEFIITRKYQTIALEPQYTGVKYVDQYNYVNNTEMTIEGEKFDLFFNIKDSRFTEGTGLPILDGMEKDMISQIVLQTTDNAVLVFNNGNSKLIVTYIIGTEIDNKVRSISRVEGYLFSK